MILGNDYVITTRFYDSEGNLTDPDGVTALIQKPDGTQETPTPTSSEVGVWVTSDTADMAGLWFYQITGTDAEGDVVDSGSFCVELGLVPV